MLVTKIGDLLRIAFNTTDKDFSETYHKLTGSEMIIFSSAVTITKLFNDWRLRYIINNISMN